ncbi:phosphomannomutase/phosphoglucomutase [Methylomonas sp. MgM2]
MGRIFSIVAMISVVMMLSVGGGIYWLSSTNADAAKREAVNSIVNNAAINLSQQTDILQKAVDGLARSPDVVNALSSNDPDMIKAAAANLQTAIPYNLRLRLLAPDVDDLDESQTPHMGFGDIEMVRATLTGKPAPVIQGDTEDRHLAITSAVRKGEKVVGVVLASLDADFPKQILSKVQLADGFIELKQDNLLLSNAGNAAAKDGDPTIIPITNTRWKIASWSSTGVSLGETTILATIFALPILLSCLAYFIAYRKLAEFFHQDQSSILKAAKDMIQGKNLGNYPMKLEELQPIIAAMAQFKRVISQEHIPSIKDEAEEKDDFFDESFDLDFLEDTAPISVSDSVATASARAHVDEEQDFVSDKETDQIAYTPDSWDMEVKAATPKASSETAAVIQSKSAASVTIFHEHEISGLVGNGIDENTFEKIGRAFASEAKQLDTKTIVVARDGRLSSAALAQALIKGIVSTGCDVLDLGLIPTPLLCFVAHHTDGRTGIMVTGSNLPAEYNGLKAVLHDEPISEQQIEAIKNRIENNDFLESEPGSVEQNTLFSDEYLGILSEEIHIARPMTVALDCGNGATGNLGPVLLKTIGCDVIEINCEIDGKFPNHLPDPSNPDNLEALIQAVKLNNADVGIAFDGDGDRMGLVDSGGKIIWPDRQMMLFARELLASKPGSEIVFDAACSKHLPEQIKKRGGYPVPWKNGRTNLQLRMRETGAPMAGDISGHFLFHDRWFGFADALYAAVRMIEILSADLLSSSSELFDELPDSVSTPEIRVPLPTGESTAFIEEMAKRAEFNDAYITDTDGMRVEFSDGWGLIRSTDTPPSITLRFEADDRDALIRIQAQFKTLMLKIKPDITLPF